MEAVARKAGRASRAPLLSYGLGWRFVFIAGLISIAAGLRAPAPALLLCGGATMALAWFGLRTGNGGTKWMPGGIALFFLFDAKPAPISVAAAMILLLGGLWMARGERMRLDAMPPDDAPIFQDDRFDQPGDWEYLNEDKDFSQRLLRVNDYIFAETLMPMRGDATEVLAMYRNQWDWWPRGISRDFRRREDGVTDQILIPVWWYWVQVGMRFFPPVELPGSGWRLPGYLTGSFVGPASFDFIPIEGTDSIMVRGRFHGAQDFVPFIPHNYVSKSHLRAEAGTLPWPFGPGTGWRGLRTRLEAERARPSKVSAAP